MKKIPHGQMVEQQQSCGKFLLDHQVCQEPPLPLQPCSTHAPP